MAKKKKKGFIAIKGDEEIEEESDLLDASPASELLPVFPGEVTLY
jgi:hypothetical protein